MGQGSNVLSPLGAFFTERPAPGTWAVIVASCAAGALAFLSRADSSNPISDALGLVPSTVFADWRFWMLATNLLAEQHPAPWIASIAVLLVFGSIAEDAIGTPRMLAMALVAAAAAGLCYWFESPGASEPRGGLAPFAAASFALVALRFPRAELNHFPTGGARIGWIAMAISIVLGAILLERLAVRGIRGAYPFLPTILGAVAGGVFAFLPERLPFSRRAKPRPANRARFSMGHSGRHSDADDRYNDPHWKLDQ